MRRSQIWLVCLALVAIGLPAQIGTAAVYSAPHYKANTNAQVCCAAGGVQGVLGCCSVNDNSGGCGTGGACGCCGSPATKLGRGVANFLTGWLEVPKHVITGTFNANVSPIEGFAVGVVRGFSRGLERTGIGLYEAVTFPLPGFDPLLCPEYVSLEPNCTNWRVGNYYGCTVSPPCAPVANNGCNWVANGLNKPAAPVASNAPPAAPPRRQQARVNVQAPQRAGSGSARGGSATYPDDYLK